MPCLIIDQMHDSLIPLLEKAGIDYDYQPDITRAGVEEIIGNYEGLILRSKLKMDTPLLEKAKKIRYIARAGAGVDHIDEAYLERRKITLFNAPEGNRDAVGEHTIGMLLCLFNKLNTADLEVRQKLWRREENRGIEIKGKTIGIVGYGNMGKAVAKRFQGFECTLLAYDKYKVNYEDKYAKGVTQEELFERADIISFHIPLNDSNKYLIDDNYINSFKKDIYFINMARGEVVTLQTIANGLKSGKIKGACLDVLENEKLNTLTPTQTKAFDFLSKQPNVLFSPHVGGWTFESYARINEVLVGKIAKLMAE